MKILLILAHPDKKSFNHAITAAAIVFSTSTTEISRKLKTFGNPLVTIWKIAFLDCAV
jgi:putative NADPH-quinone reductase